MSLDNKQMTGASGDDQGSGINYWLRLSDEMAIYILCHLPHKSLKTVSLVNKKFRDLSRDDSLWTELTLDYGDIEHNEESCRKLVKRCKKLASLKISNKSHNWITMDIMTVVIGAKETLKSLDLRNNVWTPAAIEKLGCLKNLTSLTLTISTALKKIYAGMLGELANLEKLEVLNLMIPEDCYKCYSLLPIMNSMFKKLRKLKRVDIDFGYGVVGEGEGFVDALVTNNPDLTVLHLMNYSFLSDETLDLLANSCLGLEEFSYACVLFGEDNNTLSDRGIERMVRSAKNLKHLRLDLGLGRGRAPQVTRDLAQRLWLLYPDIHIRIN